MKLFRWLALILSVAVCTATAGAPAVLTVPASGVIGVQPRHLDPEFWIRQQAHPRKVVLDSAAIAAQNQRLQQLDPSVHELEKLPANLTRAEVTAWIEKLSSPPHTPLFDDKGAVLDASAIAAFSDNLDRAAIPVTQATRFGLVTHRAALRTFPTRTRVFKQRGDTDIDRFQESALFPGTAVAIIHRSRDGQWLFVISNLYAAWIDTDAVAEGSREQVLAYGRKSPYLVVTGAKARTVFTPEQPAVSELQLDMGVRLPLLADWPADKPVNGQHPYAAHVIELPIRGSDGSLRFAPALLSITADAQTRYLPLTRANVLRQSFKFLGERYGWGHDYNGRDCSGFVSDVYSSFGVRLPRNTRDQGVSPALNRIAFSDADDRKVRRAALQRLQVGDLVYIPGHVMMVIGHDHGEPYVIHDVAGLSFRKPGGEKTRTVLNAVSVSPLTPLLFNDAQTFVDRIYSIQRIRPQVRP